MAIPKFVVTAGTDGVNALMDIDVDGDLDAHPLAGLKGQFTPNLKPGLYPIDDGMYWLEPIEFTLDSDGKLNGDSGVELLSSVDGLELLQWSISFDRATLNGKRLDIPPWWFNARASGETVTLESLMSVKQRSGVWLAIGARAPRLSAGSFDTEGNLLLENYDGSQLTPIPVPDGMLVLIDNGDGTWDVL